MKHIPDETFVFITDDKENRRLALEEKIPSFSGTPHKIRQQHSLIVSYF